MLVRGIGVVGCFGVGSEALLRAAVASTAPDNAGPLRASADGLAEFVPARAMRRMDHLTKMALLGAHLALRDAGLDRGSLADTAVILATGYGPAQTTFDFLDSILDDGVQLASPTAFSHSVQNIPAATIALNLGLRGPCATVSQFESSFAAALLTARLWLCEGRAERVLVGAVDECTQVLEYCSDRLAGAERRGRARLPLGEGAAFLVMDERSESGAYGRIGSVWMGRGPELWPDGECAVYLDRPPQALSEASSMPEVLRGAARCRAAAWGNMPVAVAFDAACCLVDPERSELSLCCSYDGYGNDVVIEVEGGRS